jgi:hypothetical protein
MKHGMQGAGTPARWAVAAILFAGAFLSGGMATADIAPPPPEPGEQDQAGVIPFLVGEWGYDCSVPDRAVFDAEAVSVPEESGKPPVRRPVTRSMLHGEFGMVHTAADQQGAKAYVIVFQVLDQDAIRVIEQVEDGRPLGMVKHELVMRRCR